MAFLTSECKIALKLVHINVTLFSVIVQINVNIIDSSS